MHLTWSSRDPSATLPLLFSSFFISLDYFMLFSRFHLFSFFLGVVSPHISQTNVKIATL